MRSSFLLSALTALSLTSAATTDVCDAPKFASLTCLEDHPPAALICDNAPPKTITLTVTTRILDVNTVKTTAHATSQTTVRSTETSLTTEYVTSGPVKTITTYETEFRTEHATQTTYLCPALAAAASCNPSNAISAFGSLQNEGLERACSCIGHQIPSTTVTSYITQTPVNTRTTSFQGQAPTTTIYNIVVSTITSTQRPIEEVTKTTTSCTTSTKTQSYAAPTFTQVYGPKAGCADASGPAKKLDSSVKDMKKATRQCKALCEQDSKCSFVFVQRFFTKGGGARFQCSFDDHHLDIEQDLVCGKKAGIQGLAVGYDACDRGTGEL